MGFKEGSNILYASLKRKKLWVLCLGIILCLSACAQKVLEWDEPPEMTIDPTKIYLATIKTEKGDIQIELFADRAPLTVNNFVFLAEEGYYDDTTFFRVIQGFMAQAGDPTGTGTSSPGYVFEDEFHPDLMFDGEGYLGMANRGPNTNGSQFFITYSPQLHLTGKHTIFGKVVSGMDVATKLTPRSPQDSPDVPADALLTIEIETVPESLLPTPTPTPIPIVPEPEAGRPLAALDVADRENLYTGKPAMQLDLSKSYRAIVTTTQGDFVIELKPDSAPESVNNFVVLAELGFYDDFPFAFIDPEALFLTGAPSGEPDSHIGYSLPAEVDLPNVRGAVGLWVSQDTLQASGSQFYVVLKDVPLLNEDFPVFGVVVGGMDVIDSLTMEDRIEMITIEVE
jgi:cyclophilin family peptidyl-prolyl cis-trans isomerase